jgi:hypothetical protein
LNPHCSRCGFENPAGVALRGQFAGVLAHFFPQEGPRPFRCPSRATPNALKASYAARPPSHQSEEDVSFGPFWEAAMGGTAQADAGVVRPIPWPPGVEHDEDGFHHLPVIDTGPMAPTGMRFGRREQSPDGLSQLVRGTPIRVGFLAVMRRQRDSCRRAFFPREYYQNSLLGLVLGHLALDGQGKLPHPPGRRARRL